MCAPAWVDHDLVLKVLSENIRGGSGLGGAVRDPDLLRSALSRPHHKWHYEDPRPDLFDLAAAYCFGILKNHPLADGNKRTGYAVAALFLAGNGVECAPPDEAIVKAMPEVAGGDMDEAALAGWLREHSAAA